MKQSAERVRKLVDWACRQQTSIGCSPTPYFRVYASVGVVVISRVVRGQDHLLHEPPSGTYRLTHVQNTIHVLRW